jgi:hypothetical protein
VFSNICNVHPVVETTLELNCALFPCYMVQKTSERVSCFETLFLLPR